MHEVGFGWVRLGAEPALPEEAEESGGDSTRHPRELLRVASQS